MRCPRLSPINHLINSIGCKDAIVAFGEDCQIGGFLFHLGAARTRAFAIGTVALYTLCQKLRLAKIEILRSSRRIQCN